MIRLPRKRILRVDIRFQRQLEELLEFRIIIEVKCFSNPDDDLIEFYRSIGQYQTYLTALAYTGEKDPIYLAIPLEAYHRIQEHPEMYLTLQNLGIACVIIDIAKEEIVQWIEPN